METRGRKRNPFNTMVVQSIREWLEGGESSTPLTVTTHTGSRKAAQNLRTCADYRELREEYQVPLSIYVVDDAHFVVKRRGDKQ